MMVSRNKLRQLLISGTLITTNFQSTRSFTVITTKRTLKPLPSVPSLKPHTVYDTIRKENTKRIHTDVESASQSSTNKNKLQLNMCKSTNITNNNRKESPFRVNISDAFDGGNGQFVKSEIINGQLTVYVDVKNDPFTSLENKSHSQYFSFRSTLSLPANYNGSGKNSSAKVKYVIANASKTSYAKAWDGSTTFVSTTPSDPFSWKRQTDTTYDASTGELSWEFVHDPASSAVHFAYFPPYSLDRHVDFISKCTLSPSAHVQSLGQTLDGREMDYVTVGTGNKQCWIIHRQHPGETMAEFYAEGLLERLLGLNGGYSVDGTTSDALKMYTFHIVPNMCPDGSFRGHLRTNAKGQNLNREWFPSGNESDGTYYDAPTLERSPEVYHVLNKMDETGVDVFLDVHGDEVLPFNFLAGGEGCSNWSERLKALHGAFLAKYSKANSDMQIPVAYEPEAPGNARTNVCSNQVTIRFDCLSATLEMPFKDCMSNPDPTRGWNPARAKMLGASVVDPLVYVAPYLRMEGSFWEDAFSSEDAYVKPTRHYETLDMFQK